MESCGSWNAHDVRMTGYTTRPNERPVCKDQDRLQRSGALSSAADGRASEELGAADGRTSEVRPRVISSGPRDHAAMLDSSSPMDQLTLDHTVIEDTNYTYSTRGVKPPGADDMVQPPGIPEIEHGCDPGSIDLGNLVTREFPSGINLDHNLTSNVGSWRVAAARDHVSTPAADSNSMETKVRQDHGAGDDGGTNTMMAWVASEEILHEFTWEENQAALGCNMADVAAADDEYCLQSTTRRIGDAETHVSDPAEMDMEVDCSHPHDYDQLRKENPSQGWAMQWPAQRSQPHHLIGARDLPEKGAGGGANAARYPPLPEGIAERIKREGSSTRWTWQPQYVHPSVAVCAVLPSSGVSPALQSAHRGCGSARKSTAVINAAPAASAQSMPEGPKVGNKIKALTIEGTLTLSTPICALGDRVKGAWFGATTARTLHEAIETLDAESRIPAGGAIAGRFAYSHADERDRWRAKAVLIIHARGERGRMTTLSDLDRIAEHLRRRFNLCHEADGRLPSCVAAELTAVPPTWQTPTDEDCPQHGGHDMLLPHAAAMAFASTLPLCTPRARAATSYKAVSTGPAQTPNHPEVSLTSSRGASACPDANEFDAPRIAAAMHATQCAASLQPEAPTRTRESRVTDWHRAGISSGSAVSVLTDDECSPTGRSKQKGGAVGAASPYGGKPKGVVKTRSKGRSNKTIRIKGLVTGHTPISELGGQITGAWFGINAAHYLHEAVNALDKQDRRPATPMGPSAERLARATATELARWRAKAIELAKAASGQAQKLPRMTASDDLERIAAHLRTLLYIKLADTGADGTIHGNTSAVQQVSAPGARRVLHLAEIEHVDRPSNLEDIESSAFDREELSASSGGDEDEGRSAAERVASSEPLVHAHVQLVPQLLPHGERNGTPDHSRAPPAHVDSNTMTDGGIFLRRMTAEEAHDYEDFSDTDSDDDAFHECEST